MISMVQTTIATMHSTPWRGYFKCLCERELKWLYKGIVINYVRGRLEYFFEKLNFLLAHALVLR